ncbi:hypothetical protein LG315_12370 [Microbacterium marinum]|uniref:hypothetical protein n=1 Tax=Microbacterium marinum TaxID=421115 RepID=UPI00384BE385
MEAPLDRQYYVTGGNAGVYKLEEKQVSARQLDSIETGALDATELGSLTFIQVDPEEGEQLPTEVQSDQL